MYDILAQIIDHTYTQGDSMQQYIIYCACVIICLLTVVFVDMIYRVFRHFWRT